MASAESLFYTNLLLLEFDGPLLSRKYGADVASSSMFRRSNPKAMQVVMYYLLIRLDRDKYQQVFKKDRCWPPRQGDRHQLRQFKTVCLDVLSELEAENAIPPNMVRKSLLDTAQGQRFYKLMWRLSEHVLRVNLETEKELHRKKSSHSGLLEDPNINLPPLTAKPLRPTQQHLHPALMLAYRVRIEVLARLFATNAHAAEEAKQEWTEMANHLQEEHVRLISIRQRLLVEREQLLDAAEQQPDADASETASSAASARMQRLQEFGEKGLSSQRTVLRRTALRMLEEHTIRASGRNCDLSKACEHWAEAMNQTVTGKQSRTLMKEGLEHCINAGQGGLTTSPADDAAQWSDGISHKLIELNSRRKRAEQERKDWESSVSALQMGIERGRGHSEASAEEISSGASERLLAPHTPQPSYVALQPKKALNGPTSGRHLSYGGASSPVSPLYPSTVSSPAAPQTPTLRVIRNERTEEEMLRKLRLSIRRVANDFANEGGPSESPVRQSAQVIAYSDNENMESSDDHNDYSASENEMEADADDREEYLDMEDDDNKRPDFVGRGAASDHHSDHAQLEGEHEYEDETHDEYKESSIPDHRLLEDSISIHREDSDRFDLLGDDSDSSFDLTSMVDGKGDVQRMLDSFVE